MVPAFWIWVGHFRRETNKRICREYGGNVPASWCQHHGDYYPPALRVPPIDNPKKSRRLMISFALVSPSPSSAFTKDIHKQYIRDNPVSDKRFSPPVKDTPFVTFPVCTAYAAAISKNDQGPKARAAMFQLKNN
jgi:hypothetical protein